MELTLNGYKAHAVTGGVTLDADAPTLILIHGAGMDSTVWQMQSRYMAHRGVRVLAVDLPGHGQSDGDVISSIEAMAHSWMRRAVGPFRSPVTQWARLLHSKSRPVRPSVCEILPCWDAPQKCLSILT